MGFKIGDDAFTEGGEKVHVLACTGDGYVVQPYIEVECEDGSLDVDLGLPVTHRRLYREAPTFVVDGRIASLHKTEAELLARISELRESVRAVEAESKQAEERMKRLSRYQGLRHLERFLGGEIACVLTGPVHGYEIHSPEWMEQSDEYTGRRGRGIRLLSLFGRTGGNLEWRIGQYSDDSGGSYRVSPCASVEEAEELRREWITQAMNDAMASGNDLKREQVAKHAEKFGVPMPPDFREWLETYRAEKQRAERERLQKVIDEAQAKLAEISA